MSYLKKIEFCKVYFNNHYENVFDRESFFNENTEEYSYIDFDDNTKGFDPNFNAKITLREGVNVTYYNNVNYCRVTMNDDFKLYYFITDYEFTNSGSVITFTLEKDVWHSNLSIINTREFQNHKQYIKRLTYDGFYFKNGKCYYDNFIKDENFDGKIYEVNYDLKNNTNKIKMLYLKMTLDADFARGVKPIIDSRGTEFTTMLSSCGYEAPLIHLYFPAFAVRNNSYVDENIGAVLPYYGADESEYINTIYWTFSMFRVFCDAYSSHIVNMSFTFFPPFEQTYLTNTSLPYVSNFNDQTFKPVYGILRNNVTTPVRCFMGLGSYEVTTNNKINVAYEFNYTINPLSYDINDVMKTIGRLHYYPFEYNSLKGNGFSEIIIPNLYNTELNCDAKVIMGCNPFLKLKYDGLTHEKYISLSNNGQLLVNKDSYSEFLRSNNNQLANSTSFSMLNGVIKGFTGKNLTDKLTGVLDVVNSLASTSARINDAINSPDKISIPSVNALEDLFYQDDIYFTHSYATDYILYANIAFYLHKYGINYSQCGNPFEQRHQRFDYVMLENCDLELPLLSDTNKLRDILNNGVRIWHCVTNVAPEFETFQINYVNYPMNIINALQTTEYVEKEEFDRPIIIEKEEN